MYRLETFKYFKIYVVFTMVNRATVQKAINRYEVMIDALNYLKRVKGYGMNIDWKEVKTKYKLTPTEIKQIKSKL